MTSEPTKSSQEVVDFWFDAICPFAWITSRWMKEVEQVRNITVRWHAMSLSVLNEGRDHNPEYTERMKQAWVPARAAVLVEERAGQEALGDFYTAMGTRIHHDERGDQLDAVVGEALQELGLDDDILQIAQTEQVDEKLRESHQQGISLVGDDVGTPVVSFNGTAFFGPVLTRIPRGEEAGTIFDGAVALAAYPYFYEIKRSRTTRPEFD